MLKILRKKGFAKVMIWIIAIVIIISFGFMATAYLLTGSGGSSYAGRIFNKKISYMDYDAAYRATVIDAMLQYGSQFGKIRSYLNIDAQTWDRLILIHDVNRKRISATDEEVVETIQGSPYFQRDGQFDSLLYRDTMRYFFRIEDRTFEEVIRDKVRFAKLYDQITGDITATETEVLDAFRKKNERIQVSYIFIAPEKFEKDVKVTDELTKTYFEANSEQFRVPSSINVEYITLAFPQNTMIETINTDGEEPVSSSEDDQEELKEPIRTKANALFEDLLIDPKFEVLAQKEQLEIKTSGFFSQAEPNLSLGWPFESLNRIFSLQVGEISEPFETSNGMVIAKIKERKDSYIPEYKEIRAKVKEAVIKEESKRIAATKSQEYLEQLKTEMNK
ncbi:MAG: SurA N-terminal domain-containing protein, partial [Candidatus Omnitrophica bacterium]|nr:SurA N-terminal domain-containing protein [Candidatus Omnitrophota bacterium]